MSFGKTGAKFVVLWLGMSVFLAYGQTKESRRMDELATQIVVRASMEKLVNIVDVLSEPPTNLPIQVTEARGLLAISRGDPELLKANTQRLGLEPELFSSFLFGGWKYDPLDAPKRLRRSHR